VKVFISSVRYRLGDERDALPPFLSLFDHQGLRFEDFTSKNASSRAACLAGVAAADVYVLLLGPKYGDPYPDSGLSPTAEEFAAARNSGMPILVFNKTTDEPDEPKQAEFKAEVGHYVNGRFWKSFKDPLSLNQAVGAALKEMPTPGRPLRLQPITAALSVPWLDEIPALRPRDVSAPVLELHMLPVGISAISGAGALGAASKALGRDARITGFIADSEPLQVGSDNDRAWAVRAPETKHHRSNSPVGWTEEAWRGATVNAGGAASAWISLPTDMFGSLVDTATAHQHVATMLALIAPHVTESETVSTALRLKPADQLQEGDPKELGHRNTGYGRLGGGGLTIELRPTFVVTRVALSGSIGDLAAELAARVLNDVRSIRH
jgi:hypothetical protein